MNHCKVPDCNGVTEYDDNAQAVLCTTCGTVATEGVLTHDWDGEASGSSLYFGPTSLKSLRRVGGVLSGQSSKEDRDRRNTTAMHKYIIGILNKLACSGLAPRAQSLFDQARVRGKYRWGKKAVLVAGACIGVVLRERRKGIMMSHLASLMDVSPHSLCRMFTHVDTLLSLNVPAFDPIALLPILQSYLKDLVSSSTCSLPRTIVKVIQPLPPASVLRLATSLATLVNRLELSSSDAPAPATACALFILALEGRAMSSLPSYVLLAQELGKKVGAHKDLVVGQYRIVCKIVEEWMEDVPWIVGADHPDNKLGKKRRKTSQRDTIAMGLKDVVQFQEDILKARQARETESPVTLSLDIAEEDGDWERSTAYSQTTESSTLTIGQKRKRSETPDVSVSSKFHRFNRARRSRPLNRLDMASLALLSPSHPLASDTRVTQTPSHVSDVSDMQTYILTSTSFPSNVRLTRLQRLATTRGSEREIEDHELFDDGELEGFIRTEDEVNKLRDFFGWGSPNEDEDAPSDPSQSFLQDSDWDLADRSIWADLGNAEGVDQLGTFDNNEQLLGEWREASPGGRGDGDGDNFDISGEW